MYDRENQEVPVSTFDYEQFLASCVFFVKVLLAAAPTVSMLRYTKK